MRDAAVPAPTGPAGRPGEVLRLPAFAFLWSATTIRAFGGAISGVAFQVLIVTVLHATPIEISIFSALSVVPYVFLGLIVGALMDRWRRQRTLVITSVGRALALASVTVLLLFNALNFWSLAIVTVILGVLVLFSAHLSHPALAPASVPDGESSPAVPSSSCRGLRWRSRQLTRTAGSWSCWRWYLLRSSSTASPWASKTPTTPDTGRP